MERQPNMIFLYESFLTHPGLKAALPSRVREGAGGWVRNDVDFHPPLFVSLLAPNALPFPDPPNYKY